MGHRESIEDKTGAVLAAPLATVDSCEEAIWMGHLPHHLGVDRTLYLAKQIRSEVSRDMVKRVLQGCEPCGRIDPARRVENHVPPGE